MNEQKENQIVFYLIITVTCIGFLIGLGAWQDKNNEAMLFGIIITISGFIMIRFFNSIFHFEQQSKPIIDKQKDGDVK